MFLFYDFFKEALTPLEIIRPVIIGEAHVCSRRKARHVGGDINTQGCTFLKEIYVQNYSSLLQVDLLLSTLNMA